MKINKSIRKLAIDRIHDRLWSELYDNEHPIGLIRHVEIIHELNYWSNESWRLQ